MAYHISGGGGMGKGTQIKLGNITNWSLWNFNIVYNIYLKFLKMRALQKLERGRCAFLLSGI